MEITGKFSFKADQETVWRLLMDPQAIANALPGVDRLVPLEGEANAWRATVKIGIASVSGMYSGTVRLSDLNPPHEYRLTARGEGRQSIIGGSVLLRLSYDPQSGCTNLNWVADAHISGKLASIGQRVIGAAALLLSKLFFRALARQLPNYLDEDYAEEGGQEAAT